MAQYNFEILVEGGDISAIGSHLTADSVEYINASFSFDNSWDDLIKTAIFRTGDIVYHTPLENDCCKIPHEVLNEGMLYISVFGVKDSTRATTGELAVYIQNSGYTKCEPVSPTPDPFDYFITIATDCKKIAQESADTAVSAAASAQASQQEAAILEEQARLHAIDAGLLVERAMEVTNAEIQNHISGELYAHPAISSLAMEAKAIAEGKSSSLCFDTAEQLFDWIDGKFERTDGKTAANLKTGDNLYILDVNVPDYWWDGTGIQLLETEKIDLRDFYTKSDIDYKIRNSAFEVISRSDYNEAYKSGSLDSGRIYFVFEEEEI